jgi:hypothetical protein
VVVPPRAWSLVVTKYCRHPVYSDLKKFLPIHKEMYTFSTYGVSKSKYGNEDHMTNSDETLFDGYRYEVCKY